MPQPVLALDIGGTKMAAALVDAGGRVLREVTRPTPAADETALWAAVSAVLSEARAGVAVAAVGIGCGGPLDVPAGSVSPINIPAWRDFPLPRLVGELVPGVPVALANDAVCMALGEQRHGAGRCVDTLLGTVVSTGVGGGLVAGGRPVSGRTGNAGHVGHVVVEPDGRRCPCGGRGCLETVAAGPHLVARAAERGWAGGDTAELARAARAGDPVAAEAFHRAGTALGQVFAGVAAVCDLDLVVVGGGVSAAGELLFEPLRAALARHARLEFLRGLRVVPAPLGPRAGLVGAACLARDAARP